MQAMGIGQLAGALRERFAGKKGIDGKGDKKKHKKHYGRITPMDNKNSIRKHRMMEQG